MNGHGIFKENYTGKGWWAPLALHMNRVGRCINNIVGSGDVTVTKNHAGGLDIYCKSGGGGGYSIVDHPFRLFKYYADDDLKHENLLYGMTPGSINNYTVEMPDPPLAPVGSPSYLILTVQIDESDGSFDTRELSFVDTLPDFTNTLSCIALARVIQPSTGDDEIEIQQLVTHSLWYARCGGPVSYVHYYGAV